MKGSVVAAVRDTGGAPGNSTKTIFRKGRKKMKEGLKVFFFFLSFTSSSVQARRDEMFKKNSTMRGVQRQRCKCCKGLERDKSNTILLKKRCVITMVMLTEHR